MLRDLLARIAHDGRIAVPGAALIVVVVGLVWYAFASPLTGVLAVTVYENGPVHAALIHLDDLSETPYPFTGSQEANVLAAVPNASLERAVFITKSKAEPRTLSIGNTDGSGAVPVFSGTVELPSWSPDGGSIAFAEFSGDPKSITGRPEEWTVYRAVQNGDSLVVGKGYHPFPSPLQRTFVLTSRGIALLAYHDSEPSVVVASPVDVPISTPFTVSQDGTRVAWVAPADKSPQVFENQNGYFVPLLVTQGARPQSMVFSPNGRYLIGATHSEATTTLKLIKVSSGSVRTVGDFPGFIELHTWLYE